MGMSEGGALAGEWLFRREEGGPPDGMVVQWVRW